MGNIDEANSSTAADENDAGAETDGVMFDVHENKWIPCPSYTGMTLTPLPAELPECASKWVFQRQTRAQFMRDLPDFSAFGSAHALANSNFMQGEPCIPDVQDNCGCGRQLATAKMLPSAWFIVRTCMGAVARLRYQACCECGEVKEWNPASEYIHSISYEEGGIINLDAKMNLIYWKSSN